MSNLKDKYLTEVKQKLAEEFNLKNPLAIPGLTKIVVNMGIADARENEGVLAKAKINLAAITGQIPVVTKARKSISSFKLTQGQPIGLMVTLRGEKMYIFLEKLINVVLPKVRDFRGVSDQAFDQAGNYNLGLREQIIFPEVDYIMRHDPASAGKNVDKTRGLQVTINTSAASPEVGKMLLELMGMPFKKG